MISLDVTHLIVAALALLGPPLLRRLQAPPDPPPPPPPAAVPVLSPDVAALLPLHGAVLNLALKLLSQQASQPAPPPAAK
ncbi:MAG TPA: hypothetical protein VFW33_15010 [Gemmataceae bacterium]|nr:hypothetical protein [Gemmataceae bacterium]